MDWLQACYYRVLVCRWFFLLFFIGGLYSEGATAGILLSGTRIIFNADGRSASTVVTNVADQDYAVQVWVSDQEEAAASAVPFIAMPALFRVRSGGEQVVRIIKTLGELPQDRESVFYLNAQEIPVANKGQKNSLKIAIRTRIKLFYRPVGLLGDAADAAAELRWELIAGPSGQRLKVINPTPYHITFNGVEVSGGGKVAKINEAEMVPPKSTRDYLLDKKIKAPRVEVEYSIINDFGGYNKSIIKNVAM